MRTKISVCIPAYNEEENILKCLVSISSQQGVNIEEILVGVNSSTDMTRKIVEEYQNCDSRIKVVDSPQGKANAWNAMNSIAKNDIRIFQDGDCIAFPDSYSQLLTELVDNDIVGVSVYRNTKGRNIIIKIINTPKRFINPCPRLNGNLYVMRYSKIRGKMASKMNLTEMPSNTINDDKFLYIVADKIKIAENIFVQISTAHSIEEEIRRHKRMHYGNLLLKSQLPEFYAQKIDNSRYYHKRFSIWFAMLRKASIFEKILYPFIFPLKLACFYYIKNQASKVSLESKVVWK